MVKSDADSTVVLSVNINCCDSCSKKVKKLLLKVKGVVSVDVDREKRLVSVTGKADTNLLIKAIGKMKKKAEVVPNEPTSESESEQNANQTAKTDEAPPPPPPTTTTTNGLDEEVCTDRYCRTHNRHEMNYYPVMQEYRAMPPSAYYPPQWMSLRQDEYGHPSMIRQGYGVNYPEHYQYGPGFHNYYNNFS